MPDTFTVSVERPEVWRVTFNNPPVNKVDPEMILELQALVGQLETDRDVRVVIFDSAIPEHFLGPYDMSRAADTPSEPGPAGMPPWLDLTARLARLAALIGRARALEVILGSQPFDGATAERYGLVNRALPDRDLDAFVAALASSIAGAGQYALTHAKAIVNDATLPPDDELVAAYEAFFSSVAPGAG
jgi:enoyl-CoA hydratase/carnithine racemase